MLPFSIVFLRTPRKQDAKQKKKKAKNNKKKKTEKKTEKNKAAFAVEHGPSFASGLLLFPSPVFWW